MKTDDGLVVLTRYDSYYAEKFLTILEKSAVLPSLLIVSYTPLVARFRMLRYLARKIGWVDALRYNYRFFMPLLKRLLTIGHYPRLPCFEAFGCKIIKCKDINSKEVVRVLSDSNVKKIILAQSGIVRDEILELPGKWIVNAHPGMLPQYRGVDVVKWALLDKAPVKVTLHEVAKGVDTGDVLEIKDVPVYPGDSISEIEERSISISLEMLASAAINGPSHYGKGIMQPRNIGKQYYLMPYRIRRKLVSNWENIRANYESH